MIMRASIRRSILPAGERPRTVLTGPGRGVRLNLDPRDGDGRLWLGLYEAELWRHVRRLCRPGMTCFDVGGSQGYYALMFTKITRSRLVTFEADPSLCRTIRANLALNPASAKLVEIREGRVGGPDESGATTLDAVADETFEPDLIKMDIEGAEADALIGAARILKGTRPALILEVHGRQVEQDCTQILRSHGYQPTTVDPRGWLAETRPLAHNRWLVAAGAGMGG